MKGFILAIMKNFERDGNKISAYYHPLKYPLETENGNSSSTADAATSKKEIPENQKWSD